MAMFLAGISVIIIRRIGRWSSEAFLEYIREQVESFTYGVSQRMLSFEHFHNLNAEANENIIGLPETQQEIFIEQQSSDTMEGESIHISHRVQFPDIALGHDTENTSNPEGIQE